MGRSEDPSDNNQSWWALQTLLETRWQPGVVLMLKSGVEGG